MCAGMRTRPGEVLRGAKSTVRHLGLTLRKVHSGDSCVRSREGDTHALYTDDLEDAVNTAVRMVRKATRMNETTATCHAILWLSPTDGWARRNKSQHGGKATSCRSGDIFLPRQYRGTTREPRGRGDQREMNSASENQPTPLRPKLGEKTPTTRTAQAIQRRGEVSIGILRTASGRPRAPASHRVCMR